MLTNRKHKNIISLQLENIKAVIKVISNKVLALRRKYGLTQQTIADELGISKSAYSLKENGHRSFKAKELFKVFKIFRKQNKHLNMQDFF